MRAEVRVRPARRIASFSAGALEQPFVKKAIDVVFCCLGMTTAEILAHHVDARLEHIQRRAEFLAKPVRAATLRL